MPNRETGTDKAAADPLIGTALAGRYRLLDVIAKGGMGRIYRAEQAPLARMVAVKVLSVRFEADEDPGFEDRFFLEAATLAKLKHPNTVTVFDYGHDAGTWYMVMELVDGRPLSEVLRREGPLEPRRVLRIAYEIARSLTEAHQHGIVHRDLKPSNVMLLVGDEGESVKVVDFGIVKVLEESGSDAITRPDRMVGSPRYMAPEQIKKGDVDGRADLYALGIMMYELLTGEPPFKGRTTIKTLMGHVQDPVPPMADKTDRPIPAAVERLVLRCLQKKPENRFPDVHTLKLALRGGLAELGTVVGDTIEPREDLPVEPPEEVAPAPAGDSTTLAAVPPELSGRSPLLMFGAIAAAAGLLLLSVGALYTAWTWQPAAPPPETLTSTDVEPAAPDLESWHESEVWVTSNPSGAEVWEGDRLWGTTPIKLPLRLGPGDPPRTLEARLDGYRAVAFEQGPSEVDLDRHVVLEARPRPSAPPPRPEPALDIRTER